MFVVVGEKRSIGRHPVRVWELPQEVVEIGRLQYLEGLEKCKEYDEFGCGLDIEQLDMRGLIRLGDLFMSWDFYNLTTQKARKEYRCDAMDFIQNSMSIEEFTQSEQAQIINSRKARGAK